MIKYGLAVQKEASQKFLSIDNFLFFAIFNSERSVQRQGITSV